MRSSLCDRFQLYHINANVAYRSRSYEYKTVDIFCFIHELFIFISVVLLERDLVAYTQAHNGRSFGMSFCRSQTDSIFDFYLSILFDTLKKIICLESIIGDRPSSAALY